MVHSVHGGHRQVSPRARWYPGLLTLVLSTVLMSLCEDRSSRVTASPSPIMRHADFEASFPAFSPSWTDDFVAADGGVCSSAVDAYIWRDEGWGSNINVLLETWIYFISVASRNDLSLVVDPALFRRIDCRAESNGVESAGWNCIFAPIPHVCVFESTWDWKDFMTSKHVPTPVQQRSIERAHHIFPHFSGGIPDKHFTKYDIDIMGALSMLEAMLRDHVQPWLQEEVDTILKEEEVLAVRSVPFVALHVRRGDKLLYEAEPVQVEAYLFEAECFLRESAPNVSTEDIEGIWISSDDSTVLQDVKRLAKQFFPRVNESKIVSISARSALPLPERDELDELATHAHQQTYMSLANLLAELRMLAEADVFVGTFSSNMARLTALQRESLGKPRDTTVSVDIPSWFPGR